jgi:uncharacterized protein (DUF433 family)
VSESKEQEVARINAENAALRALEAGLSAEDILEAVRYALDNAEEET